MRFLLLGDGVRGGFDLLAGDGLDLVAGEGQWLCDGGGSEVRGRMVPGRVELGFGLLHQLLLVLVRHDVEVDDLVFEDFDHACGGLCDVLCCVDVDDECILVSTREMFGSAKVVEGHAQVILLVDDLKVDVISACQP